MSEWLAVGKVRTSFGVRGEVKVLSFSGEYEHFYRFETVSLRKGSQSRSLSVETFSWSGETPLLKFKGVDTPETAKILADWEIWVERVKAAPLKSGEYYLADLIGCSLSFEGGAVGEITGYLEGGIAPLLEVLKRDGKFCIVPFQERFLGQIDLTGRTVELKTDWILE